MAKNKYDNQFKYKMIALLCDGKTARDLERDYGIQSTSAIRWLRTFISDGPFDEKELSPEETATLEKLREDAVRRELQLRPKEQTKDTTLRWVLEFDNDLEAWRALAEEWLQTQVRGKNAAMKGLSQFFQKYLVDENIPKSVGKFLSKGYLAPDFYKPCFSQYASHVVAQKTAKKVVSFIDWVLLEKVSIEDDLGNKRIPAEFHNPLTRYLPDVGGSARRNESDKHVLPYRYIKDLRSILCPVGAVHFKDWYYAQAATHLIGSSSTRRSLMRTTPTASLEKGRHRSTSEMQKGFRMWYASCGLLPCLWRC